MTGNKTAPAVNRCIYANADKLASGDGVCDFSQPDVGLPDEW
jgi:hypothetical protein